jgi:hypothetical protein
LGLENLDLPGFRGYDCSSKDEQEGTFFEIGVTILSLCVKNEYFSR